MVSTNDRAREKYIRRMMINGTYQADSTRERIKVSQERAKAEGRPPGRPPALTPDQVNECKRMFAENPSVSRVARIRQSSMEVQQVVIYYAHAAHRVRWRFQAGQPCTRTVPFARKSWTAASKPNWTGTPNVWVSPSSLR